MQFDLVAKLLDPPNDFCDENPSFRAKKKDWLVNWLRTDRGIDGRTSPLIEMRGLI